MLPTNSVSWLTGDEINVVNPATGFALKLNSTATTISGDSEARGATHWIRRNSSIPKFSPVSTKP